MIISYNFTQRDDSSWSLNVGEVIYRLLPCQLLYVVLTFVMCVVRINDIFDCIQAAIYGYLNVRLD